MIFELEKLSGYITRYRFHNEENSYSIATLKTKDDRNVTIVGHFPKVTSDLLYELEGTWTTHPTYGEQFRVELFKRASLNSVEGVVTYLSSDYFPGIGPKTASKIVETFGTDAISKILEDKMILREIGLNVIRIERLYQQLLSNQTLEAVNIELFELDIRGNTAAKIVAKYGQKAAVIVKSNPYKLIDDISGIGFIRADEIATKIGIEKDDPRRVKAAIIYSINEYGQKNGDTYALHEQVISYANQFLQIEIDYTNTINELVAEKKIVLEDNRYYLSPAYYAEVGVAKKILNICNQQEDSINSDIIYKAITKVEEIIGINYTEVQKEAIYEAVINPITVITGGPGTGKTTIIDGIMQVYSIINEVPQNHMQAYIKVMAPTGRAAKRMREILDFNATTIHKGLGMDYSGKFVYDDKNLIPEKLIIIDEASMIDIFLANSLLKAIKDDAKVIIVGDVDQLPSVGPGQVLKDLIDSKTIKTSYLNEIHRQAKDSNIIKLASAVNNQALDNNNLVSGNDLYLRNSFNGEIVNIIINQVQGAINQGFDIIDDIQVLIPIYKGDIGIDNINNILQDNFNETKDKKITYGTKVFYEKDKVIQLANDPENQVMNGDIGYIKTISKTKDDKDYLIVNFDGNEVTYDKAGLENLSLAYAMSIHKSQGSEYKIVILPMVRQFMHMLKKELLYTAITRAKDFLIVLGDMKLLIYAANNLAEKRQTTLKIRLEH